MGSKRHHFIPQFLLRGFASRISGAEHYCWYFRRGIKACETNTKGIGQQRNFHGNSDVDDLEARIADRENVYANLIHNFQVGRIALEDRPLIEEFIVHLIIRGRNLRQGFTKATDDLLGAFVGHFADPLNYDKRNDRIFEYVKKDSDFTALLGLIPKEHQETFLRQFRQAMNNVPIEEGMRLISGVFKASLQEKAAQAHVKTLAKDLAPKKHIEKIQNMRWTLLNGKGSLILGDVGVLFKESQDKQLKHPIISPTPECVFLPVSHEYMLFGTKDGNFEFDVNEVNKAQAALSHEFFVSSACTEQEIAWQHLIGLNSDLISSDEVSEIVRSGL